MVEKDEIVLRNDNQWFYFSKPLRVVSTTNAHEVVKSLQEIEKLVEKNKWYAAGFISYEAAPAFDPAFHVLDSKDFPLLWFGLYAKPQVIQLPSPKELYDLVWKSSIEKEVYNLGIEKIKEYIANGRTYQVNYTMRLNSSFDGDSCNFFLNLVQNQNRYAAFIHTDRYAICSASPELFFELDGEIITSRPMKGTVQRGRTTSEDTEQANWLKNSEKNQAENVMIVDMLRNDIGRIAEVGTVSVPELFSVEKYPTLFQMTSTIQAKTKASITEIFSSSFPCGSITGAPKVSTMNIISELETSPRRIYTGSIGYISPDRKARFNVAIRTALIDKKAKSIEYGVGGGIVWDSISPDEYDEAILKARVLTEQRPEFSLLETLLWTPDQGYFLLDKHIARMTDSAEYFGFVFNKENVYDFLNKLTQKFKSAQRVRVILDNAGKLDAEAKEFHSQEKTFQAALAGKSVDSQNPFLFHKTTYREMYDSIPGKDVILLYNEKDELTEFTIGNLVVELHGELITPPVPCGLLPGVFRAHLLETKEIKEQIIKKDDLNKCKKIFLINSVRKWVEVNIK